MKAHLWLIALWLCSCTGGWASTPTAVLTLESGQMQAAPLTATPDASQHWQRVQLPDDWRRTHLAVDGTTFWYRFEFAWPSNAQSPAALYIPYLSNGGTLSLNGVPLARLAETNDDYIVRWNRPHWVAIPNGLLASGLNTLQVQTVVREFGSAQQLPKLLIGPERELRPIYTQRLFLVHTVPQITVVACALIAVLLLLIWWRRPQELLYGLLGLAAFLWGLRTLTLLLEFLPVHIWPAWRFIYHTATGGFTIATALFALHFAGLRSARVERSLLLYWALAPLALLINARLLELLVLRYWTGGLLLVAVATLAVTLYASWKQRTWQAMALCAVFSVACLAGVHDFLLDKNARIFLEAAPQWSAQHIFLLHHAANVLLLVLAGILTSRFVSALNSVEASNATLELRIAARERQLAENFKELARLSRQRAIEEERERLVRDMHDGLGSQLFTCLSRVERSATSQLEMLDMLRASIAEMRLALDVWAPADDDFQSVLGNFRYRWEGELTSAGVESNWCLGELRLTAEHRLHILRILQEALTNVLKHARASKVEVEAVHCEAGVKFEVSDNGRGGACEETPYGRGVNNMRARASRIGARFDIASGPGGTRVTLLLPA